MDNDRYELLVSSSAAAFASSGFTCILFYPLDCLRIRWQVSKGTTVNTKPPPSLVQSCGGRCASSFKTGTPTTTDLHEFYSHHHTKIRKSTSQRFARLFYSNALINSTRGGILGYFFDIVKHEGLYHGLWKPGLFPSVAGMAISSGIRFGTYEVLRDDVVPLFVGAGQAEGNESKKISHVAIAACSAGTLAYIVTAPFQLIKTMIQANKEKSMMMKRRASLASVPNKPRTQIKNFSQGIFVLLSSKDGLSTLWKGTVPLASRGALLTIGQMLGYDGTKTIAKEYYGYQDAPPLHILSSITASFLASAFSAPVDLVFSKYAASLSNKRIKQNASITEICTKVIKEDGIFGLWKGSHIAFLRLVPVCLTYSMLYEQARFYLGIGYFS